jgi:colanic acid/amylovoran biosynthesis glycosyltransferase
MEKKDLSLRGSSRNIAYLVNQYPKVSHSFIRREIAALEQQGFKILRCSVRSCADELVDPADIEELPKTWTILEQPWLTLVLRAMGVFIQSPFRFLAAFRLAWQLGCQDEKTVLYHLAYLVEACTLLGWFRKASIVHVHVHFGTNSATVAMLCQALGGPSYSFTVHGPEEFDKVSSIALAKKIDHAKFVVAISSFGKSQLYRWTSFKDWSKIHVVRCGVDESFLKEPLHPLPELKNFVCIGRLSEQKGHFMLLEAVRRLSQAGHAFKVVLVGDGELRSQIESFISTHHLESYIAITGWAASAEVKRHILNAQALVLPSFGEGLPVVLMEALALGRPVITSSIAGIPELVETGVNGWLVTPGSVESLVDAMDSALKSPLHNLETMGQAGAARVAQLHNADLEAQILGGIFSKYLNTLR